MKKTYLIILPVLGVLALFGITLGFDFAWLDHIEILSGKLIAHSPSEWIQISVWDDRNYSAYHRPVYNLVHSIDYALWGQRPMGYHLSNLLLHAANTLMLLVMVKKITKDQSTALVIASLWCVLPIHAPVVALIHAKGDLLCTFFLLISGLLFISTKKSNYWIAGLTFLLSMLSKETALIGLPFFLWVSKDRKEWPTLLPILSGLLVYIILRVTSYSHWPVQWDPMRILTFPLVYGSYFFESMTGWRLGISDAVWAWSARSVSEWLPEFIMFLLAIVIQTIIWKKTPTSRPYILIFNLFLLPVSQCIPTLHFRADRFLYIPSIGWIGMMSVFVLQQLRNKNLQYLIYGMAMTYFSWRTFHELPIYKNDKSLFTTTLDRFPDTREAQAFMGLNAMQDNDEGTAIFYLTKALNANPRLYSFVDRNAVKSNLATVMIRQGAFDDALQLLEPLYENLGEPVDLDHNLGLCYKYTGRPEKAYQHFIRFQRKHPNDIKTMEKLAEVYLDLGKKQQAIDEINRILRLDPQHPHREHLLSTIQQVQESQ